MPSRKYDTAINLNQSVATSLESISRSGDGGYTIRTPPRLGMNSSFSPSLVSVLGSSCVSKNIMKHESVGITRKDESPFKIH